MIHINSPSVHQLNYLSDEAPV